MPDDKPWIQLAFVIEIAAVCISLLIPITPAGTGSTLVRIAARW